MFHIQRVQHARTGSHHLLAQTPPMMSGPVLVGRTTWQAERGILIADGANKSRQSHSPGPQSTGRELSWSRESFLFSFG